jgi:ribosome-associated protein
MLIVTPQIRIPLSEFELSYARSSGPGGQNVNKVNSKAVLRWCIFTSPSLTPDIRSRLMSRLAHRLTTEGELIVMSDKYRDQLRNREDCLEKLREILAAAAFVPKVRRKTKPSHSTVQKAKEIKRKHSQKKRMRKFSKYDD